MNFKKVITYKYTVQYGTDTFTYSEKEFEEFLEHCNENKSYHQVKSILKEES